MTPADIDVAYDEAVAEVLSTVRREVLQIEAAANALVEQAVRAQNLENVRSRLRGEG